MKTATWSPKKIKSLCGEILKKIDLDRYVQAFDEFSCDLYGPLEKVVVSCMPV